MAAPGVDDGVESPGAAPRSGTTDDATDDATGDATDDAIDPLEPMSEAIGRRLHRWVVDGASAIADEWGELCRWDPMLPPEAAPPSPVDVILAVGDAMGRPQPIGLGPDPAVEAAMDDFADAVGSVDLVIGELACLKEAIRRHLVPRIPPASAVEVLGRLDVVVDRAALVATTRLLAQLWTEALADSLTGLWNRRAFQRDVAREAARATRHGRPFALAVLDLDGLKQVNDQLGHPAGDVALQGMAEAMLSCLRAGARATG